MFSQHKRPTQHRTKERRVFAAATTNPNIQEQLIHCPQAEECFHKSGANLSDCPAELVHWGSGRYYQFTTSQCRDTLRLLHYCALHAHERYLQQKEAWGRQQGWVCGGVEGCQNYCWEEGKRDVVVRYNQRAADEAPRLDVQSWVYLPQEYSGFSIFLLGDLFKDEVAGKG